MEQGDLIEDGAAVGSFLNDTDLHFARYTRADYNSNVDLPREQDWESAIGGLTDGMLMMGECNYEVEPAENLDDSLAEPYGDQVVIFDLGLDYVNGSDSSTALEGVSEDPMVESLYFAGFHDLHLLPYDFE